MLVKIGWAASIFAFILVQSPISPNIFVLYDRLGLLLPLFVQNDVALTHILLLVEARRHLASFPITGIFMKRAYL